jgi:uncharacterized repeat protein (TIGR03803 family)
MDGSNFTVLTNFYCGWSPTSGLVLSGSALYAAGGGGSNGLGTVLRINTDGSGFSVLKNFTGPDGANPFAAPILCGTMLFGTTANGGSGYRDYDPFSGHGTVFGLDTGGGAYTVLMSFNGAGPWTAGLCISGTTLYGTTCYGGISNCGVVFSLTLPAPKITPPPQNQTAEEGMPVNLVVRCIDDPTPTYQWIFNGSAITGCTTNCDLCLSNVQATNTGTYTVVVSNCYGAVTNASVALGVIPRVDRRAVPALDLLGESGIALNLEYADALGSPTNWLPLDMVDLTAAPQLYLDVSAPLPPQRFYRVWQTGTPTVLPSLNLPFMVPAITLTGNIGDQLRLDYINQFGQTDAWVNLDTVTLTNTSQLYFDLFAPSQPRRLYRIEPVP